MVLFRVEQLAKDEEEGVRLSALVLLAGATGCDAWGGSLHMCVRVWV